MTCPNCKCYVLNSWKRCEYCGAFLDTGKTKTVSISAYYNENQNLNRKRLQQQNYYNRNTQIMTLNTYTEVLAGIIIILMKIPFPMSLMNINRQVILYTQYFLQL